jgi:hypothetical protein
MGELGREFKSGVERQMFRVGSFEFRVGNLPARVGIGWQVDEGRMQNGECRKDGKWVRFQRPKTPNWL